MGKLKDIWKQQDLSDLNIRREDLKKLLSKKSKGYLGRSAVQQRLPQDIKHCKL